MGLLWWTNGQEEQGGGRYRGCGGLRSTLVGSEGEDQGFKDQRAEASGAV